MFNNSSKKLLNNLYKFIKFKREKASQTWQHYLIIGKPESASYLQRDILIYDVIITYLTSKTYRNVEDTLIRNRRIK
jgi:hypothetical protein